MSYHWIIFDADGTLFDFDRAEAGALQETFDAFGMVFEQRTGDLYHQINSAIWRELEQGAITPEALRVERFRRLFDALNLAIDPAAFSGRYLDHLSHRGDLIDGAEELVKALRGRYRLLILTNGLSEVQRTRLAHSGLAEYFEDIVISDEVGAAKPDGRIFDVAFERMGNPAKADVLIVGDSLSSDIAGGQAYGIDTCWFNPAAQPRPAGLAIRYEVARLTDLVTCLALLPEGLSTRHLTLDDASAVLALLIACDIAEYGEPDSDLESLLDDWRPLDLARDAWLIQDPSGRVLGYLAVFAREPGYGVDMYVHPEHSGAGLQAFLLARCEERTRERLSSGTSAPLRVIVPSVAQAEQEVLLSSGYSVEKYYFRMQIDLEEPPPVAAWPDGCRLRLFVPGQDDRRVYEFVMEAFRWPGYIPPSFEDWRGRMLETETFRADLWFLLVAEGDELVGTALCVDYELYGWVRNLAVAETWRGRGIGAALLQHVFGEFYGRGQQRIGLGVDGKNPDAYRFYERVGMRQVRQFVEYALQIDASTGSLQ